MQLSLNWLKDFVEIPKSITPEELGKKLSIHTVEVEAVANQSEKYKNVIIGKILEIRKHPNADRLQIAKVDIEKEKLDIVCGAPNIAIGQLVPVALVGAKLPSGIEIKEAEVRGEKSCGMLCAEDELGLGNNHAGILILDKKAKIGSSFADYLELNDVIFEVDNKSITNRPDLWGHMGIAREISAFLNTKFKPLETRLNEKELANAKEKLNIKVDDKTLCPRYMAIALEGIKVEASPKWIQERILAGGMRPINNIVDITNYVMLELGQPLHAFDKKIVKEIKIRRAKKGEVIETLDGIKRELNESMLLITDGKKPIAIAGVMGGQTSEINNETTEIIIESANFEFSSIRKTSQKLSLRTEASMRFEKSLDPNLCELALKRTVELIRKTNKNAKIISEIKDIKEFKLNQGPIELNLAWLEMIVGEKIDERKVLEILNNLGFETDKKDNSLFVTIPTWRATKDIAIAPDLAEEIVRIYGYEKIPGNMPKIKMEPPIENKERIIERKIKDILVKSNALTEICNYSFVGEDDLKKLGIDYKNYIKIANPIASHQTMLRQTLAPNLLNNIKLNQPRFNNISIFEIGSIYLSSEGDIKKNGVKGGNLPYQEKVIGIALAGERKDKLFKKIKGVISSLLENFNVNAVFKPLDIIISWGDKNYSADIFVENENIGSIYKLDEKMAKANGIKKEVYISEIGLRKLFILIANRKPKQYREYEKYPSLKRDLAFVLNGDIMYNDIKNAILNFNPIIKSAELFDVFEGGKLGSGKKNMAFSLIYQADRTLTSEEVDKIQKELIKELEKKFEAKFRNF